MTDLNKLWDLCSQALDDRRQAEIDAGAQTDLEAVKLAADYAVSVFGEDTAATFGEWTAVIGMADDCLQALAKLTPCAYIRFTAHFEDGTWFDLVTHCPKCRHGRETRVGSLVGLADALVETGVRG